MWQEIWAFLRFPELNLLVIFWMHFYLIRLQLFFKKWSCCYCQHGWIDKNLDLLERTKIHGWYQLEQIKHGNLMVGCWKQLQWRL